jgi:hypothetical protein
MQNWGQGVFKVTVGNGSLHDYSNGCRALNFITEKNPDREDHVPVLKHKYTWTSSGRRLTV